jgi:hypothetical protein
MTQKKTFASVEKNGFMSGESPGARFSPVEVFAPCHTLHAQTATHAPTVIKEREKILK